MGGEQSSAASNVSSKSEEPSSPSTDFTSSSEEDVGPGDGDQDKDLRGDVTSDCPGV